MQLKNRRSRNIIILFLFYFFVFQACRVDENGIIEEENHKNLASSISLLDFENINTKKIEISSINSKIVNSNQFYNVNPSMDRTGIDINNLCFQKKFKEYNAVFEKDKMNTFKLILDDKSYSECFQDEENQDIKINSLSMSLEMREIKFIDEGGNEINPEGKYYHELSEMRIIQGRQKGYSKLIYSRSNHSEPSISILVSKFLESAKESIEKPCQIEGFIHSRDCMRISLHEHENKSLQGLKIFDLEKIIFRKGLEISERGLFYTQGIVDFTVNDWEGTMYYGKSTDERPVFEMTNGKSIVKGIFGGYIIIRSLPVNYILH